MTPVPATINLGLVSHTNAGKTTLARTLLRSDIGEVEDRPHVTDSAQSHVLIESALGDSLVLWDTPGFGDSARLLKRLKASANPWGWLLAQVWDRFAERALFCSRQALVNARETSDILLYVVNAGEEAAAYVELELEILAWLDKPIVLLLNQLGPPRSAPRLDAETERWRQRLAQHRSVRAVLPFDAFARCWIQEHTLLYQLERALPASAQEAFARLREAWRQRNLEVFERSMRVLTKQLASIAGDRESLSERSFGKKARAWIGSVAMGAGDNDVEHAQARLAKRLEARAREATEQLVALHGLSGRASADVLARLGHEFAVQRPTDPDKASLLAGVVSGAIGGLAADLAAGGLTFGAGALIGGVLGALGARELTQAYNLARGAEGGAVRWSGDFLASRLNASLLRYLAVAHFGRGRGDFVAGNIPIHFQQAVADALAAQAEALASVWSSAHSEAELDSQLHPLIRQAGERVLLALYPDGREVFAGPAAARRPPPKWTPPGPPV